MQFLIATFSRADIKIIFLNIFRKTIGQVKQCIDGAKRDQQGSHAAIDQDIGKFSLA